VRGLNKSTATAADIFVISLLPEGALKQHDCATSPSLVREQPSAVAADRYRPLVPRIRF
jgi:hypothetical protein